MPKLLAYTAIAIVVAVSAAFSAEEDPLKNFDVSIDCGALYKPPGKNILTVLRPVTVTLMPNNISITFEKGSDLVPNGCFRCGCRRIGNAKMSHAERLIL
jgi:hypothetical protein